ncbi:MAG: AtpZ/AtpI family protein [Thermodesulfobacteriota bacterium]
MKEEDRKFYRSLVYVSSMGMSFALCIVIGLGIGLYLDQKVFGTMPVFTLIFLVLGIVAGYRNVYLVFKRAKKM